MKKKSFISVDDMMKLLDDTYAKVLVGIPKVSPPIEEFANDYLSKHNSKEKTLKIGREYIGIRMADYEFK